MVKKLAQGLGMQLKLEFIPTAVKKIVSVSDKVKSDLEKVVKQDFISSNGAYIPEERRDMM